MKNSLYTLAVALFFLCNCSTDTIPVQSDDSPISSESSAGSPSHESSSSAGILSSESSSSAGIPSSESSSSAGSLFSEQFLSAIVSDGNYTTKDSVAGYLCKYGKLPGTYRTKSEAIALYESDGNSFSKWNFNPWKVLGIMVGGDVFSNRENLLPSGSYREADVDYSGDNRGTKRLIYADSCIIYYTANHYESFVQIQ